MFPRIMLKMITLFRPKTSNQLTQTVLNSKLRILGCSCKLKSVTCSLSTSNNLYAVRQMKSERHVPHSSKAKIIAHLNFKKAEDAEPFYELPISTLYQIQNATLNDVRNGFCENRLYYIASQIQCDPAELSQKLAKRSFVYKLSFEWLESSLKELLDKGVPGERIVRDLWVLKYHHKTIQERLQRIKDVGIKNLFPWMVRCSPDILNRYLKITQDTKSILGDRTTTQMYLADRLNISTEDVDEMCFKIPALKTIRAIKVKHFLDFLINEGFAIEDIASKPRILGSSPKTVKQRLEHLRKLGLMDINLNLLCRSKKDFTKVCESLAAGKDCNNET